MTPRDSSSSKDREGGCMRKFRAKLRTTKNTGGLFQASGRRRIPMPCRRADSLKQNHEYCNSI